jgi:DNA-binding NarL/FixJ family response regulator
MLHRAEILQLRGAWSEALVEAERAREQLSQPPPKATVGGAFYRLGELHRLRGEFAEAEKAYLRAQQWERTPEPGIAQLRLVQGRLRESHTAIRNIADAVKGGEARVRVLDAYVEIALAAGDLIAARSAADELERTAARTGATYLQALASRAIGAVLLAESEPRAALNSLRLSCKLWCELEAEYDAARVRVLIAGASRRLGDVDNAELELSAARDVFKELGATADLALTEGAFATAHLRKIAAPQQNPLSERETEVLRVVAEGMTNKQIAGKLSISEKTVARHLSNIFAKLDLSSRAAATAYAYQNGFVRVPIT